MLEGKTNGSLVYLLRRVLRSAPVSWDKIYARAGLADIMENPDQYISLDQIGDILAMAQEESGDEYLVLNYYDHKRAFFFPNLYGGLMSMTRSMREFEDLHARYALLQNIGASAIRIKEEKGFCIMDIDIPGESAGKEQLADLLTLYSNSIAKIMSGEGWPLHHLNVIRKQTKPELYIRHLGPVKINKGNASTSMYLDLSVYERRFKVRDSHELLPLAIKFADEKVSRFKKEQPFLVNAKSQILKRLGRNDVSVDILAEDLAMSRATLYRRLGEYGTSFQKLYDDVRHYEAIHYLVDSDMDQADICDILGFSSDSSFIRFFRRVEGMTPQAYRKEFRS